MTPEQREQYIRDLREDFADFREAHRIESGGKRWVYVQARILPLPGMRLRELETRGWIETDGCFGYRPR